jgi:hypothetical protein
MPQFLLKNARIFDGVNGDCPEGMNRGKECPADSCWSWDFGLDETDLWVGTNHVDAL